jgi:hypothetical protein
VLVVPPLPPLADAPPVPAEPPLAVSPPRAPESLPLKCVSDFPPHAAPSIKSAPAAHDIVDV